MGAYPPALSEIVLRALAPEPDDRFPTMQALQIALESFARASGLALSTVALAAFIQELFADELAAWRAAQREGKSLGEHLAAKPVVVASADPAERTATDAFGTTRQRARRRGPRRRARGRRGLRRAVRDRGRRAGETLDGRRRRHEGRRRERRNKSAVGGAGRGKESGYRTDRGKNHAVVYGDSRRGGGRCRHHDDHDHGRR